MNWGCRRKPARRRRRGPERGSIPGHPPVTGATPGWAMERELHRSASRRGSGGKRRPPLAPGCRGSGGAPDERGRRGAPGRANALSSPGRQKKGRRRRKARKKPEDGSGSDYNRRCRKLRTITREPIDADAPPGQNPGAPISVKWELGTGGGVAPGPSPATLKGSRTFGVAAGGCPALPSGEGGVRASCPRVRAWGRVVPGPPTGWVAGLTADLSNLEGKGR